MTPDFHDLRINDITNREGCTELELSNDISHRTLLKFRDNKKKYSWNVIIVIIIVIIIFKIIIN